MAERPIEDDSVYDIPEAKAALKCGTTKLYMIIGAGLLDARKSGKRTVITRASVRKYLANLPAADIRTGQKRTIGAVGEAA